MKQLLLFSFALAVTCAQAYSGAGAGTAEDPYRVTNADELFELRNEPEAHYILYNDIDLAEFIQDESPALGWTPIPSFKGELDGNGMTISGLYINRPSQNYVGLFATLSGSAVSIHNLIIDAPMVTGSQYTAVIAGTGTGEIHDVTINNATVTGSSYVAGFIGYHQSGQINLHGCKICDATITSTGSYAGGMIGRSTVSSEISGNSLVNVKVKSINGNYEGGICGHGNNSIVHSNVVLGGMVSGKSNVGGVFGYMTGSVSNVQSHYNNYIACDVTGTGNVGGILGCLSTNRIVRNNYYCGTINASSSYAGGIVGREENTSSPVSRIDNNFSEGRIRSTGSNVGGILGYRAEHTPYILSNVCVMDTIAGSSSSSVRRIQNGNSATTYVGNNYALATMVLMAGSQQVEVQTDDIYNGISYGARTLKRASTYQGIGFDDSWTLVDGHHPWLAIQSAPPVITSAEGSTVTGTAEGDGVVYVLVGEKLYTGTVSGGAWSVAVEPLDAEAVVRVSVATGGKMPSVLVSTAAGEGGGGGDEPGPGDDPQPGDNEVVLKVNARYSTFTPAKDVTLIGVEGVKAYAATAYVDGKVTFIPISEIPAGQGVVIEAEPGNYVLPTTIIHNCQSNYMMGCLSSTTVGKGNNAYTNLVLEEGDATTARFASVTETTTVPAGKAYLRLPLAGVASGSFTLQFFVNGYGDLNRDGRVDVIDINHLINLILTQ